MDDLYRVLVTLACEVVVVAYKAEHVDCPYDHVGCVTAVADVDDSMGHCLVSFAPVPGSNLVGYCYGSTMTALVFPMGHFDFVTLNVAFDLVEAD